MLLMYAGWENFRGPDAEAVLVYGSNVVSSESRERTQEPWLSPGPLTVARSKGQQRQRRAKWRENGEKAEENRLSPLPYGLVVVDRVWEIGRAHV